MYSYTQQSSLLLKDFSFKMKMKKIDLAFNVAEIYTMNIFYV